MPTAGHIGTDLYEVLGVDASTSGDDIARAFRTRAKRLHPDTSDEPDAAARFNELVAAYDVLSNHRTRREYDQARADPRRNDVAGQGQVAPTDAPTKRWSRRRAWTALVAGTLVTLLGVGAAIMTWQMHEHDARRHARFRPVTAVRTGDGDITFVTAEGRVVQTREPELHGEGTGAGPTVDVRYDPADPAHVIVDSNTVGRDITLAVVALKLLVGGMVFAVLGARRLRTQAVTGVR